MTMIDVQHEPEKQRFVIYHEQGDCLLEYQLQGQSIDFTSTYIPFRLRGQGLAEALVDAGLAWAQAQGFEQQASCWYVAKRLAR